MKSKNGQWHILTAAIVAANCMLMQQLPAQPAAAKPVAGDLERNFVDPPHPAKPWVYWINMDGHFTKEGITADLESMKAVGIGGMIHMDVAPQTSCRDIVRKVQGLDYNH